MKKKAKKEHQVNIRLDDERYAKLNDLDEKSGMRKSDIIRNLIDKGAVNVFYGQKDIMARRGKRIAHLYLLILFINIIYTYP